MREYGRRADRDFTKLASTTRGAGSGAAWKRLGYLAEALWSGERALVEEARRRLTAGYIRLDPHVARRGTLVRRWRLWVNATVAPASEGT